LVIDRHNPKKFKAQLAQVSVGLVRVQFMSWFQDLTGFPEDGNGNIRTLLVQEGESIRSRVNNRQMFCGRLELPSLAELRQNVGEVGTASRQLSLAHVMADVKSLHLEPQNAGAFFQAASQFNLLEMVDPSMKPEAGVTRYIFDPTQGPACATAAGAGTIYRNYFVPVDGQLGQSARHQVDCLADLGQALGNEDSRLWCMTNGYALATEDGLDLITKRLKASSESERDQLRGLLRIGVQIDTEVTWNNCGHKVTQAYCSALPVAYCDHPVSAWEEAARLVLEASYEATICAAIGHYTRTGNNKIYLTLLGGGVFGNELHWITAAIDRALRMYQQWPLDVCLVGRRSPAKEVQDLLHRYSQ
jgi:hypothetical protein